MRKRPWIGIALAWIVLAGTGCSVNSSKNHYVLAEKLWTDGKYAAAVSEFEKVASRDAKGPLGQQALYRAAMTQAYFLSQYTDAIRKFRTFVDQSGNSENAWNAQKEIGEILYSKLEQYDPAIQHYRSLLKLKPDAAEAPEFMYRIGKGHFFLWQFDEAVKAFKTLINKYPGTPWAEKAAFEVGMTLFTRGEQRPNERGPGMETYQEAIDSFQRFIRKHPQSELVSQARFGIASCLEELDQLDAAYHAYEALKTSYPSPNVIEIKLARIRDRKAQRSR